MTDGSGGRQPSRTHYSKTVVDAAGATQGAVFGDIPDGIWYDSLLARDTGFFIEVLGRFHRDLEPFDDVQIIADAVDGYNPMHDLAHAFGTALNAMHGDEHPLLCSAAIPHVAGKVELDLHLDAAAKARKQAAVENYLPLAEEARRILEQDPKSLENEYLISQNFDWNASWTPAWERIGRDRVAKGLYETCITYAENVQPVAQALIREGRKSTGVA
ncbi:hypothetical protein GA830_12760 [Mesorhizobium sp. NBSH29]|nr:hypothetical protein GA830_12760 [Mesorhizobium sp. NBSH29]